MGKLAALRRCRCSVGGNNKRQERAGGLCLHGEAASAPHTGGREMRSTQAGDRRLPAPDGTAGCSRHKTPKPGCADAELGRVAGQGSVVAKIVHVKGSRACLIKVGVTKSL